MLEDSVLDPFQEVQAVLADMEDLEVVPEDLVLEVVLVQPTELLELADSVVADLEDLEEELEDQGSVAELEDLDMEELEDLEVEDLEDSVVDQVDPRYPFFLMTTNLTLEMEVTATGNRFLKALTDR